jgi:Flp pilus assembly protein TadD
MGVSLVRQRRVQEAIGHFAKACRTKPDYGEAHFSLGMAYLEAGNKTAAKEEYEILKRLHPGFASALLKRLSAL